MRHILFTCILLFSADALYAGSSQDYYDSKGRYVGTSYTMGDRTVFVNKYGKEGSETVGDSKDDYETFDSSGKYTGHDYAHGQESDAFNKSEEYVGSTYTEGHISNTYDKYGRYIGSSYTEGNEVESYYGPNE